MKQKVFFMSFVLVGLVATVLIAGCTMEVTPVSSPENQVSVEYPKSGQSQLVQACITHDHDTVKNWTSFRVIWQNNTTAEVYGTYIIGGTKLATIYDAFIHFPTIEAANAYFDSQRSTYPDKPVLDSTVIYYKGLTGHDPTVFKQLSNGLSKITQYDALVIKTSFAERSLNSA